MGTESTIIIICVILFIVLWLLASCIKIVPQAHAYIVERLGGYQATWNVGIHFKVPIIDKVARKVNLKEKTGLTFPIYIGAMLAAALLRNIAEYSGKATIHMGEINDLGGICLSLFLGMAMITLRLWELASLALPLVVLLAAQTALIAFFAYFILFRVMGKDYDAAILSAGTCGFGMGATPNAMANMQALCDRYVPSVKAYLLIPLIGSLFADFINSLVITFFINIL